MADDQVGANDVRPGGGGTDPGPKGEKSYPAPGGPIAQGDDSQGGSGGGTDPGPKGTQSYPTQGGPMNSQDGK